MTVIEDRWRKQRNLELALQSGESKHLGIRGDDKPYNLVAKKQLECMYENLVDALCILWFW